MGDGGSVSCGVGITGDTVLDADLTCTQGPELVIVADGVVLHLGGHTVCEAPGGAGNVVEELTAKDNIGTSDSVFGDAS